MAPFESTDHAFINSTDDIEEGTTNQYFTQDRARQSFGVVNQALNPFGNQVFDGQTYIYGGLDLTNGTITYIPPTPVNLSAYAPLDSPTLTGTPTINGTDIKVNEGDGALTEKNFTSELNNKLNNIEDGADVTPTWVPEADPGYQTASDVTTAISGKQDTLSNGVGVSIQNNYVNIAQDVGPSSNVQFGGLTLSNGAAFSGMFNIYDAFPATSSPKFAVNNLNGTVTINDGSQSQTITATKIAQWDSGSSSTTTLTGSGFDVTVGTYPGNTNIPQLKANGNNDVHVYYADRTGLLNGAGFDITVGQYPGQPSIAQLKVGGNNSVHVFYAEIAGGANHLRGHKQITSVNLYGGTSVSLFGNGANNVHVFYADIAGRLSDDRIKWNETPINTDRTIEIVKRLKFYQYDILKEPRKGSLDPEEPYDPSKCKVGFGVIAQEIEELGNEYPELKDTPFQLDEIKGVGYDNIFALLGATTQMLISRIETLENEVALLKAKLNIVKIA